MFAQLYVIFISYSFAAEPIREVEEVIKQKPQAQVPRPKTSRTFVNFERAKKQQKSAQVSAMLILFWYTV